MQKRVVCQGMAYFFHICGPKTDADQDMLLQRKQIVIIYPFYFGMLYNVICNRLSILVTDKFWPKTNPV